MTELQDSSSGQHQGETHSQCAAASPAMSLPKPKEATPGTNKRSGQSRYDPHMPPAAARKVVGSELYVGYSTHDIDQAWEAKKLGVDYIGFGPIFSTSTKPDALSERGIEKLAEIVSTVAPLPVIAIGGISRNNLADVAATGTAGAAVISALGSKKNGTMNIGNVFRDMQGIWVANTP